MISLLRIWSNSFAGVRSPCHVHAMSEPHPERTSIAIPFTEAVPKIDCVLMLVVVLVLVLVAIAPEAGHAIVPNASGSISISLHFCCRRCATGTCSPTSTSISTSFHDMHCLRNFCNSCMHVCMYACARMQCWWQCSYVKR